jgi:hypothetical protein
MAAMKHGGSGPLRDFFRKLAERTFRDLGLFDEQIVSYLASMLAQFAHADGLYRVRSASGKPVDTVVEMLAERPPDPGRGDPLMHQRAMRQYVGDYALFMSGLFRTHIERRGILDLYLKAGRQCYWKVSELDLALYRTGFLMFQELSKKFEYYSGALDYMRKAHFAPSPKADPFADFLRQVDRWVRVGISSN